MSTSQEIQWILKDKYHGQKTLDDKEVQADIKRLAAGEPIAYIIGWVNFLHCKIDVSYKTLIPRPETEYWVEQLIKQLKTEPAQQSFSPIKILDLCCGSGCIGIALLKNLPNCTVDFVDIDPNAIAQTTLNITLNHLNPARANVFLSDVFDHVSGEYDVIVANPPYVSFSGEVGEETKHEPQHAIFAQNKGMELINQVILNIKKYLKSDGKVILEFGKGQEEAVEKVAKKAEFKVVEFRKDQFGVVRWVELKNI